MIYLDHHASTPVDPHVVAAMLPWMTTDFGNPHSHTHAVGRRAAQACDDAIESIATRIGGRPDSIVITSGATESNNLAIWGVLSHPRQRRRHVITVATEHPAVLEPVIGLAEQGFRVTVLPVRQQGDPACGQVDLDALRDAIDDHTALVSIMWANNEIGTLQPIRELAEIAHAAGALFHTDATQALGRVPVDCLAAEVDLLSGSAHKFYGPKGVGFLHVGGGARRVRLRPLFRGGGQQRGLRGGTVNSPGLIGMATALQICTDDLPAMSERLRTLRDELWRRMGESFPGIELNGPTLDPGLRLVDNLNVSPLDVEGETLMAAAPELAISSGAACSSVDPRPSHVLTAIGLSESRARRSLRFGLGRGTTADEIDSAVGMLRAAYGRLTGQATA
ncbi:MAG: cysteine desulfurase [Planctomycetaceae bacterium]|nr:MAG: cysteine desulfurase [Planctomycetaceae bacterium]